MIAFCGSQDVDKSRPGNLLNGATGIKQRISRERGGHVALGAVYAVVPIRKDANPINHRNTVDRRPEEIEVVMKRVGISRGRAVHRVKIGDEQEEFLNAVDGEVIALDGQNVLDLCVAHAHTNCGEQHESDDHTNVSHAMNSLGPAAISESAATPVTS